MKLSFRRSVWMSTLVAVAVSAVAGQAGADVQDPGARKRLGKAGEWKDTMVGVVLNEKIYTVEKGGGLYKTDMTTGKWEQIPKASFPKAKFLMAAGSNLYYSNTDGDLYVVNPSKGTKSRLGARGVWKNVVKAVGLNGSLYSAFSWFINRTVSA